jgi:hypothetical protein
MMSKVEAALSPWRESDVSVKVLSGLFSVLPQAPPFRLYGNLEGAISRLGGEAAGDDSVGRARELAASAEAEKALWVAENLDKADAGLAVYAGLKNVLSFFGGGRSKRTFESDPQQAGDAGLKLLGLAYMASQLFPGRSPQQRFEAVMALPAGQEALYYFAVAEVGLPFADNLVEGGTRVLGRIVGLARGDAGRKLSQFGGGNMLNEALGSLDGFAGPLASYLDGARGVVGNLPRMAARVMPSALNLADSATGAAASALDALPVWSFLGPRLIAEACASRAIAGE